jgi:hypothetical protein
VAGRVRVFALVPSENRFDPVLGRFLIHDRNPSPHGRPMLTSTDNADRQHRC